MLTEEEKVNEQNDINPPEEEKETIDVQVEENKAQEEEKVPLQKGEELDDNEVFEIRRKLLSTEEYKPFGNRLLEDYKYDMEGENGLFEANPRVVKIEGFELNKKVTLKIQVTNKSKWSERIIILPPKTPFFKIKCLKRGQIPPGLCEVIMLTFTPQNYQYYNDSILINCPCNKIIIPLYAYPRMNIHTKYYIPKQIDLGNIPVDTKEPKEIIVKNIIDIPFKYEISPVKTCNEITISPLNGEFPALQESKIAISFAPKTYGIFRGEFMFKMNEINFTPYVFSVFGTCHNFYNKSNIDEATGGKLSVIEMLKNKSKSKKNVIPNKTEEEENKSSIKSENEKENENENENENIPTEAVDDNKNNLPLLSLSNSQASNKVLSKTLSKFKDFPSNKEREFLNFYNNADSIIQAKEFKYLRFIGKKPLNEDQTKELLDERNNRIQGLIDTKCNLDKNLHINELDKEPCEIDRDLKFYLLPNFNTNQNDNFFKTRHYQKLFLKGITKVVIRKRVDDHLKNITNMLTKNDIKTREDFKNYCEKDWLDFYGKDQQTASDNTSFNFLQMKFIPPIALNREKVYLTNEYSINSLKQEISHDNDLNLDEYKEFAPLERNDEEVIGYKPLINPGLTQFDINLGEKPQRPSCESESLIRLERGDTELSPEKNETLYDIADTHLKHLYTEAEDLIFNNPALKRYSISTWYSESDIDFNLQPRTIQNAYMPVSNYHNEIYMKCNLSYCDNENIKIKKVDNDTILYDTSLNFVRMNRMKGPDQKDLNIKRGEIVDEDNYVHEMTRDKEKEILDMYDKEDEKIGKLREENMDGTIDVKKVEKIKLENKMIMHKKKWMSTVPTMMEFFNSGVVNPNNKFVI